jgi:hypothetical protein
MKTTEKTNWFVLFSYGDSRTTMYGWCVVDKEEENTKAQASKVGKRIAKRKGESQFNYYFVVNTPYVTDSIEAFIKKCNSVNLNPNLEDYI